MNLYINSIKKTFLQKKIDGCIKVVTDPSTAIIYRITYSAASDDKSKIQSEEKLKNSGIYLLLNSTNNTLYVGQGCKRDNAHGVLARMVENHSSKNEINDWDIGYVIVSQAKEKLDATFLNWLERSFYDEAKKLADVGKFTLLNANKPRSDSIDSSDEGGFEDFKNTALLLLKEAGCNIFENQEKKSQQKQTKVRFSSTQPVQKANTKFTSETNKNLQEESSYVDTTREILYKFSQDKNYAILFAKNKPLFLINSKQQKVEVKSWTRLFVQLVSELNKIDSLKLRYLAKENIIHKNKKNANGSKIPIITENPKDINSGELIANSGLYLETNLSSEMVIRYSYEFLQQYSLESQWFFAVQNNPKDVPPSYIYSVSKDVVINNNGKPKTE